MDLQKEKKLLEKIEKAIDLIEASEINEGFNILKLCQDRLELSNLPDSDLHMLVYHNLSMCSQVIQDFEESCKYLEKTIKIAKSRDCSQDIEKIRNTRYISMLYIQQGALLSHLGNHEESISAAKNAFNFISQSFQLCISVGSSFKPLSSYNYQNYKTLESCLFYLSGKTNKFPSNCGKIIQRTSLGVLHYTDWIYSFAVSDILDIKPLKYFEIKNCHTFLAEVSKDFMLEKICLLLTACYLIATESRLSENPEDVKKAKIWHFRAVEIGTVLMPIETPLFQHIKSSFEKHYPSPVVKVVSKSKTPVKDGKNLMSKSRTPVRPKISGQRKVIKDLEIKTDRSYIREKMQKIAKLKETEVKYKTQREDNQEPEPQISKDYEDSPASKTFVINSDELYGIYSEED